MTNEQFFSSHFIQGRVIREHEEFIPYTLASSSITLPASFAEISSQNSDEKCTPESLREIVFDPDLYQYDIDSRGSEQEPPSPQVSSPVGRFAAELSRRIQLQFTQNRLDNIAVNGVSADDPPTPNPEESPRSPLSDRKPRRIIRRGKQ